MPIFQQDRLYSALLNTGLQVKDNALYQVIYQLIGAVNALALTIGGSSSGGGSGGGSGPTIIIQGSPGPPGSDGLDGSDGDMGPPGNSIQGIQGITGAQGPIGPVVFIEDGEDGIDGMPGIPGADGISGGSDVIIVRKTSNESVTSSIVLINDAELTLPLDANSVYQFDLNVFYTGATAGDMRFNFTGPAGYTTVQGFFALDIGATTTNGNLLTGTRTEALVDTLIGCVGFGIMLRVTGIIVTAGTAGNLQFQWAQRVSSGTPTTVILGSHFKAIKLP